MINYIDNDRKETLAQIPIVKITGRWIKVVQTIHYNTKGSYSIKLTTENNKELLNFKQKLTTWSDNMVYARPKWGIYRSLKYDELLRDETFFLSDLEVNDLTSHSVKTD